MSSKSILIILIELYRFKVQTYNVLNHHLNDKYSAMFVAT